MYLLTELATLIEKINHYRSPKPDSPKAMQQNLLQAYWLVGQYIVIHQQLANRNHTLEKTAEDLSAILGNGFSRSNLTYMRKYFMLFSWEEVTQSLLTWSHYFEILKSHSQLEIAFYTLYAQKENWSVRQLRHKMSIKFVYQIGLQQLFRINPITRVIEKDSYQADTPAITKNKRPPAIFCETPPLQNETDHKKLATSKQKKGTLYKIFYKVRSQKTSRYAKMPKHRIKNTQNSKAPPSEGLGRFPLEGLGRFYSTQSHTNTLVS